MHIRNSDLNLLVIFQALVEEHSISRAAQRMSLSQSGMSRVFERLRRMFNDQLLVRTGKGYEPTHRALHVYSQLERFLPGIEELLRKDEFDPKEARDSFRIAATDYSAIVMFPELIRVIEESAPGIQIDISPLEEDVFRKLENNSIDLAFLVSEAPAPFRSEPLFREEFVCLVREGHPLAKRPLTLERYLDQTHVGISFSVRRQGLVDQTLDRLKQPRKIRFRVPYFASVGSIIERTNMVVTLPKRLAKRLTTMSRIRILPAPIEFKGFTFVQVWHPRYDSDPSHRWLRELIKNTALKEKL